MLKERLKQLVGQESVLSFAQKCEIGESSMRKYLDGRVPGLDKAAQIAKACNVSLQWLATGEGAMRPEEQVAQKSDEYIGIPRYDASLSAGNGFWNIDTAHELDHIPFTAEFLRRRLGRSNPDDLIILTANGDSMEPLIGDGDLVMVDQKKNELTDGVFAFVLNGMARVKRLNQTLAGDLEVMSENPLYRTEVFRKDDLINFQLIGKVVWCGHHFAR
ncbi:helix-turn-helix transcriptional regulator [uncultured Cohaesibacter sp.]|uniref:LexA family transcriptional regulator n=1 Tax=uncultured Cohaesibacter sp. TaxID=1002546 RepID=UPI002AAA8B25|nr:helix-turn-helix transcriptional regulator [uncultured Cohaesibacter sp.]